MTKAFMGVRLKTFREQQRLTQAALAASLKISPSYLNQIENDQRPLTVPVLLRLQSAHGIDLQLFSEDESARRLSEIQAVFADPRETDAVPQAEAKVVASQLPSVAKVLLHLHKRARAAEDRLSSIAADSDGDRAEGEPGLPLQPFEEVREFFYARHHYMAMLDERAEQLYETVIASASDVPVTELLARLRERLQMQHGIAVRESAANRTFDQALRSYDAATKTIALATDMDPGQQAFQLGVQLAFLEAGPLIDSFTTADAFTTSQARKLARLGFANHFAGALVLPNRRFQDAAEALRYDLELLSDRFGVGVETIGHRLSTMHHAPGRGIPFFFVRVDRAGNVSKRQSTGDFHFSRHGGTCPLWNVYEAFSQPGKILTQLSRMPDGRTYLWIARTVEHRRGGYGSPNRIFAVALGCDARYAERLVYAKGVNLVDPDAATLIGAGCKVCDRADCAQRAFPPLGRTLQIDENQRGFAPYAAGM
ncbi:short-chain fatty acyl-CoA regulator family protein [Ramlibacter sp. XY19]|uniref:short-chain fatty acyl-CoA regulator family protein n=1 Tax=Ramlibacter paludis TaxID=2908000 RepID=UPI0023DC7784|nr:short-chain fatty acyl-CoA regulator family protein [Ramlibacter paludis]MCG2593788.1 short-chain fatty acyl-CoA regulator family protein [Ramlibacter paludis]